MLSLRAHYRVQVPTVVFSGAQHLESGLRQHHLVLLPFLSRVAGSAYALSVRTPLPGYGAHSATLLVQYCEGGTSAAEAVTCPVLTSQAISPS